MVTVSHDEQRSFVTILALLFLVTISQSFALSQSPWSGRSSTAACSKRIEIWPVKIELNQVSYSYNDFSLTRRLFSSEPRREYALYNVSCSFSRKLVLLTGDSSSGKSTLLRLLMSQQHDAAADACDKTPKKNQDAFWSGKSTTSTTTTGSIYIGSYRPETSIVISTSTGSLIIPSLANQPAENNNNNPPCSPCRPKPMYLDQNPVFISNNNRRETTVYQFLQDQSRSLLLVQNNDRNQQRVFQVNSVVDFVIDMLVQVFEADDKWIKKKLPNQLLPSEVYKLRLMEASLQSMLLGKKLSSLSSNAFLSTKQQQQTTDEPQQQKSKSDNDDQSFNNNNNNDNGDVVILPAPVLLLDEWMDKETSSIIQSVEHGLVRLVEMTGAVVISITHKPERWRLTTTTATTQQEREFTTRLILRRGKVVQ